MDAAIRTLTPRDVGVARDLVHRFHSATLSDHHLESVLANPSNLLLVAEHSDRVIGFLYAHWIDRLPVEASQLFIYEVEVTRENRRTGIASSLLSTALAHARQRGARTFVFTNHSNPAAVRLYQRAGGIVKNGDDLLFIFA